MQLDIPKGNSVHSDSAPVSPSVSLKSYYSSDSADDYRQPPDLGHAIHIDLVRLALQFSCVACLPSHQRSPVRLRFSHHHRPFHRIAIFALLVWVCRYRTFRLTLRKRPASSKPTGTAVAPSSRPSGSSMTLVTLAFIMARSSLIAFAVEPSATPEWYSLYPAAPPKPSSRSLY